MSKFRIIYADPPWRFQNWSMGELAKRGDYPVMTQDDLKNLPIGNLGYKDSLMLMWATYPKLDEAIELMTHYGYQFRTVAFTWIKLNPSGIGWHFGMGFHTRGNPEIVLLGKRGKGVKRADDSIFNLVTYPRGRHSAKPPVVRDLIIQLYGDVPRCELFAREESPGFTAWGNEVPLNDAFGPLNDFIAPPYTAIVDEDEYNGLPVVDTSQLSYAPGEQMRMM